ncbi:MAG: hypothetical protein NT023_15080, partial [Armatimonadetes bacterium]|nr:hypothetical protein [Armatimonadota bacterium]
ARSSLTTPWLLQGEAKRRQSAEGDEAQNHLQGEKEDQTDYTSCLNVNGGTLFPHAGGIFLPPFA